jgi:putative glycerol kinase 5
MKFLHAGASIAHFFTRSKRFKAASVINFITNLVGPRLWWRLNEITDSRRRARLGEICFGTVDSWLVWKLTNGAVHATDYSNVGSTGLYDPYRLDWSGMLLSFLDVPLEMLPEVRDSGGSYGCIAEDIFGASIPITGIISDQTSAMFAHMCWSPGDVKCTLGTGMFIDINTGSNPHASIAGFYPIIGWKIEDDLTYLAEGMFSSIGSAIEWGEKFGLYDDPSETESIATSVDSSCGVCFVPCFDGIQAPYNDPTSTASVIGITHLTRKEHIVRALLESIAFVCKQLFDVGSSEVEYPISKIHVDGGVCRNTFVLQLISDLLCLPIHKPKELDITVYGAAYVAGLGSKFWDSREKIRGFVKHDSELNPNKDGGDKFKQYKLWQSALERSLAWYPRDS